MIQHVINKIIVLNEDENDLVLQLLNFQCGVLSSKPLGGSKVNTVFHLSEVDQVSARSFWGLSGKK